MGCSFLMVYLSLTWQPCYFGWVNHSRSAVYGGLFYTAFVLVIMVYMPQVRGGCLCEEHCGRVHRLPTPRLSV